MNDFEQCSKRLKLDLKSICCGQKVNYKWQSYQADGPLVLYFIFFKNTPMVNAVNILKVDKENPNSLIIKYGKWQNFPWKLNHLAPNVICRIMFGPKMIGWFPEQEIMIILFSSHMCNQQYNSLYGHIYGFWNVPCYVDHSQTRERRASLLFKYMGLLIVCLKVGTKCVFIRLFYNNTNTCNTFIFILFLR